MKGGLDISNTEFENIYLKDWPFEKDEKVKLYWMDKPYKQNNKWVLDSYFEGKGDIKKLTLDWATIHFLAISRYYRNGNLNSSEVKKNAQIMDLDLSRIDFKMIEDYLDIEIEGIKKKIPTKVFVGYRNKIEYRIPALEIIRAIIANTRFLLNRIVELDSLNKYFVYKYDDKNNLIINFFNEVERKLLKNKYLQHLAWLITNNNILKMFNQVGKNLWLKNDLDYDFLFYKFNIRARVKIADNRVRIFEIIDIRNKDINAKDVFYTSKYNKKNIRINKPKIRTYRGLKHNKNKLLDPKIDGAKNKESDFISTISTQHHYSRTIKINKIYDGERLVRDEIDENTQIYDVENDDIRTTADTGGLDKAKGIEYNGLYDIEVKGELEEFVEIMKLLKNKPNIKDVKVIIDYLPEGKKGKKFSKLSDGETKRRYGIGRIIMDNSEEYSLIEIEREERSLSRLLLYSMQNINWMRVYLRILLGLVNKSGTWDSQGLKRLEMNGVHCKRIRHKSEKSSIVDKCDYMYEKITV